MILSGRGRPIGAIFARKTKVEFHPDLGFLSRFTALFRRRKYFSKVARTAIKRMSLFCISVFLTVVCIQWK